MASVDTWHCVWGSGKNVVPVLPACASFFGRQRTKERKTLRVLMYYAVLTSNLHVVHMFQWCNFYI